MGRYAWHLVFALLIGAIASVGPAAMAQTATIAVAVSRTGASQLFGAPAVEGAQLAVEEANASGQSPRINLAVYDDASNADKGKEIARQVLAGDALAVVGPATTPMALAVGPIYSAGGLVCIGGTTTGDTVTQAPAFFRASFSTSDGGEMLADYLRLVLRSGKATVLFKDDGYGRPVVAGFKRGADKLGITVSYRSFNTVDEAQELARQAAADPDHPAIILAMINEAVPVLQILRRLGTQGPILGTNILAGEDFSAQFAKEPEERQQPGYFTEGVYAASPLIFDSANAATLAFADRFRSRFAHDPTYVAAQAYEATLLAIAAVSAASGHNSSADVKARRQAVRAYLASLDSPANSIAGLNGPLWFTPDRGRIQVLRIGRFHDRKFESAPGQLVPALNPDQAELASGSVVEIGPGRFVRRQQVVYTGVFINEISGVNIAQSTFTADFYLWQRFVDGAGTADPGDIQFPNMERGSFDAKRPVQQASLPDGTNYRLWRVRGDFRNDFDLHRYPFDRQTLSVRLFNATAASDRVVYVQDQRSIGNATEEPRVASSDLGIGEASASPVVQAAATDSPVVWFGSTAASEAFHKLTQWQALRASQSRDNLVTESALGDPRLVGAERVRELSGYRVDVQIRRRTLATLAKSLLPLIMMTLIMLGSLYFPHGLVKEKVTVAITAALSGAVLLAAVNAQLGAVGYTMAVEYVFYVFFALCVMAVASVLVAERLRVASRAQAAIRTEVATRVLFLTAVGATLVAAWIVTARW